MRVQVSRGGAETTTLRAGVVKGLFGNFRITSSSPTSIATDFSQCRVQGVLKRGGSTIVVYSSRLDVLARTFTPSSDEGTQTNSTRYSFQLDHAPIRLNSGDEFQITVTTPSMGTATIGGTPNSQLDFTATFTTFFGNASDVELFTPQITVHTVPSGVENYSLNSMGDNVTEIGVFSPFDRITSVQGRFSSGTSFDYLNEDLYSLMSQQYVETPTACICSIFNGTPEDGGMLNVNVNTSVSGNTFIVVKGGIITPTTQLRATQNIEAASMQGNKFFISKG